MIVNAANHYFLDYQTHQEHQALLIAEQNHNTSIEEYFRLVLAPETEKKETLDQKVTADVQSESSDETRCQSYQSGSDGEVLEQQNASNMSLFSSCAKKSNQLHPAFKPVVWCNLLSADCAALQEPEYLYSSSGGDDNQDGVVKSVWDYSESKARITWLTVGSAEVVTPDSVINTLMAMQWVGGSFSGSLYNFAKTENITNPIRNDNNEFQLQALGAKPLVIVGLIPLLFFITYLIMKRIIVHRMLGEHVPDNFRGDFDYTGEDPKDRFWMEQLRLLDKRPGPLRVQLIRTNHNRVVSRLESTLSAEIYEQRVLFVEDLLDKVAGSYVIRFDIERFLNGQGSAGANTDKITKTLLLAGLEDISIDPKLRGKALELIQQLSKFKNLNIVLLCDVGPLFRLVKQGAYPFVDEQDVAVPEEVQAWSSMLSKYEKLYDWTPLNKSRLGPDPLPSEVLENEHKGWYQLRHIYDLFTQYHDAKFNTQFAEVNNLHESGPYRCSVNRHWRQDQIVEFFASHAGSIYRHKWEQCTLHERVMLFQLANGLLVNPNNAEVLEHLVKRGYVYRDKGWFLVNESFRRFILTAENEEVFSDWLSDLSTGTWNYIRIPIFVTVLVLAAIVVISSGQSFESILATLTASLGLLPMLLKNVSLFKGTPTLSQE